MELAIMNNLLTGTRATEVEVKVIENLIRKDLEIFSWTNGMIKHFGEFQIYKDHHLELNCFDQGLSLLVGREITYGEICIESHATDRCVEYLFNYKSDHNLNSTDTALLADKFTNYLLDVSFICVHGEMEDKKKCLDDLFKRYFPEFQLMAWCNNNQKHSSNIA